MYEQHKQDENFLSFGKFQLVVENLILSELSTLFSFKVIATSIHFFLFFNVFDDFLKWLVPSLAHSSNGPSRRLLVSTSM